MSRHAALQQAEKGEDFRLKDIGTASFEDFKLSPACAQIQYSQGDMTKTPPANLSSAHLSAAFQPKAFALAESFKKGIKRDSTIFNPFKEGKRWDTFRRHLKATAMAQHAAEVLDIAHQPTTEEEKDLFAEKKKFMHLVFERTLQTDQSKALMRQHESTFDSQSI